MIVKSDEKIERVEVSMNCAIPTIVFLIFSILKLLGVITWSWWIVTIPLWISFICFIVYGWSIDCKITRINKRNEDNI
jgi:hypothetical protein